MKKNGFTILELLVVIGIVVVIGSIVAGILYSTLRDSGKIKVTSAVSQNGNYALSVMEDIINSSTSVAGKGEIGMAQCQPVSDPTPAESIKLNRVDGGITTLECLAGTTNNIASQSAEGSSSLLLDSSTVETTSCSFSCEQDNPYSPPIIDISFTVAGISSSTLQENTAAAGSGTFQTSVSMLSFNP